MLNFKELRKKKNLTQKEFAELIGVSLRSLSNYENGNIDITLKKVQEIADILEVEFDDLFLKSKEEISINRVSEPVATYGAENATALIKHIKLLEEQIKLQQDHIALQKTRIEQLEKESQPIYDLIQELKERIKQVEDFKEAVKLLSKVGSKVEEKEKLVNRKRNSSK